MKLNTILLMVILAAMLNSCCVLNPSKCQDSDDDIISDPVITEINGKAYDFSKVRFLNLGQYASDTLIGYPNYVDASANHTVYIPSVQVELLPNEFVSLAGNTLNVRRMEVNRTVHKEVVGPAQASVPGNFSALILREVEIVYEGKVVAIVQDVPVKDFNFKQYTLDNEYESSKDKSVRDVQEELRSQDDRIKRLQATIDSLMLAHPDHAAVTANNELDIIRGKLRTIRYRYANGKKPPLETINFDKQLLLNIDFSLTDLEREVDNPANNPAALNNAVFFKTGEFLITQEIQDKYVEEFIDRIVNLAQSTAQVSGVEIFDLKINLNVTGYADDQRVGDSLRTVFLQSIPTDVFNSYRDEQVILNLELSRRRGERVLEYLKNQIAAQLGLNDLTIFKDSASDGRGKSTYPETVAANSCPGKCQKRRVTLVSCLVFTTAETD